MGKREWEDEERPPHRNNNFTVPMDDEMLALGVKRAGSESRLRAVLRAFLFMWGQHEYPSPPEEVIEQQGRRAKQRRK